MAESRLLRRDHVVVPLQARSLAQATAELARSLGEAGALADPAAIDRALAHGPGRGAVRIAPDIALPHFRTDAVEHVVIGLGVSEEPLVTDDPEWSPGPRVVALVLAPTDATTFYLQAVSALARALRRPEIVAALPAARSVDDVFQLPDLAEIELRPARTVREIMIGPVAATQPEMLVRDAVDLMLQTGARALAVTGDKAEVLGMLDEADIMRGLRQRRPDEPLVPPLRVRDVMNRTVLCVADTAPLDEVAELMINKDVGEIPVVAEGRLVGLVRRVDILRTLYGR
jgi:CBS domain-containing protein